MTSLPIALRAVPVAILLLLLSACTAPGAASTASSSASPPTVSSTSTFTPSQRVLLFGEVHDNALQHAERLRTFEALLARGARPALAMEQLDRERQGAIDALFAGGAKPTADAVIAAGAPGGGQGGGWNWTFYRPFIQAALNAGVPIVAANVSRDEARRVMREGLAPLGFDAKVPADVLAAHTRDIVASHCGMIDAPMAGRMAQAQVARDQFMARVLERHAARGVVLLAGNGHVRTDIGAPRWLKPEVRAISQAVGWLEAGDGGGLQPYDLVRMTPAQTRPDPCEGMRKQVPAKPAAEATR